MVVQGWQDQPVSVTSSLATEACWAALGPVELTVQLLVAGGYLGAGLLSHHVSHCCVAMVGGGVTLILHYWHSRGGTFIPVCGFIFYGLGSRSGLGNLLCRHESKRPESLADWILS